MNLTLIPEVAPRAEKVLKKGPKWSQIKNRKIGMYLQNQIWYSTLVGHKSIFEPDQSPKNGPKKVAKRAKKKGKKIGGGGAK